MQAGPPNARFRRYPADPSCWPACSSARIASPAARSALFARVALSEGGHRVTWPVEELDMGADTLWQYAVDQNGRTDAAEFIRWRWRNRLSLTAAAEALGLSGGRLRIMRAENM